MAAVPGSLLVAFAFADYEEGRKNTAKASAVYERVLASDAVADKTLAYVQYMKFKRRTEGLSEARKVFKQARSGKDRVQYHVFVSSALMEYHCDKVRTLVFPWFWPCVEEYPLSNDYALSSRVQKVDVAEKIFRFGLDNPRQNFSGNLDYALQYIDFLSHLTEVLAIRPECPGGARSCDWALAKHSHPPTGQQHPGLV